MEGGIAVRLEKGTVVLVDPASLQAVDEGIRLFLGLAPAETEA